MPAPSVDYVAGLSKYIANLRYKPPRKTNRPSYLDPNLLLPTCTHIYIRINSHRSPLSPFYKRSYRVLAKHSKFFLINFRDHSDYVSIDRLKVAHLFFSTLNQELGSGNSAELSDDPYNYVLGATTSNMMNLIHC